MAKRSKTLSLESKNYLPEEIIEEILFKLPAKSILRFKCVSKQWRSLISSKKFIKHHLAKKLSSSDHHNLIILHPNLVNQGFRSCSLRSLLENCTITSFDYLPLMDLLGHHMPGQYYPRRSFLLGVLGSCNGLILITIDKGTLFIWNPTTRQAKKIAAPELNAFTDESILKGYNIYGFGYDEITKDYKIVCLFVSYKNRHTTTTTTEMYSLRTNCWKKIENFDGGFMFMLSYKPGMFTKGKFVNGKLHWLTYPTKDEYGCFNWDIVALDLAEEKYETVSRPQFVSYLSRSRLPRLHDLGGYLSLTNFNGEISMDVWVMTKYGEAESWIKFWTFYPMTDDTIRGSPCPLWLTVENGDIVVSFAVATGLRVVVCNGSNHNVLHTSGVDIVDHTGLINVDFEANMYVESLVSPFGDEQEQLRSQ